MINFCESKNLIDICKHIFPVLKCLIYILGSILNIYKLYFILYFPKNSWLKNASYPQIFVLFLTYTVGKKKEFFNLAEYKKEVGKDYKRITFYLCDANEFDMYEELHTSIENDDDEESNTLISTFNTTLLAPMSHCCLMTYFKTKLNKFCS